MVPRSGSSGYRFESFNVSYPIEISICRIEIFDMLSIYRIETFDTHRITTNFRYILSKISIYIASCRTLDTSYRFAPCFCFWWHRREKYLDVPISNIGIVTHRLCLFWFVVIVSNGFFFRFIGIISIKCLVIRLRPCILMSTPGPRQMRSTIEVAQSRYFFFWMTGPLSPKSSEFQSCFEKKRFLYDWVTGLLFIERCNLFFAEVRPDEVWSSFSQRPQKI